MRLWVLSVILLFCSYPLAAQTLEGEVITVIGTAEKSLDKKAWLKLRLANKVKENESVRTQAKSKLTIRLTNGTECNLEPNSECELAEMAENSQTIRVQKTGSKLNFNHKGKSKFKVVTPEATAGAEGTAFSVSINEKGGTSIQLFEGGLRVTSNLNLFKEFMLMSNQQVILFKGVSDFKIERIDPKLPEGTALPGKFGQAAPAEQGKPEDVGAKLDEKSQEKVVDDAATSGDASRLQQTNTNATGGFIPQSGDAQKQDATTPPAGAKPKGQVIINSD
jgi:hypothetical protein